ITFDSFAFKCSNHGVVGFVLLRVAEGVGLPALQSRCGPLNQATVICPQNANDVFPPSFRYGLCHRYLTTLMQLKYQLILFCQWRICMTWPSYVTRWIH